MAILLALLLPLFSACRRQGPVVAKVGDLVITRAEFNQKLSEVAPPYQKYVSTPAGRRQFLDVLIKEKMVLAAAENSGVSKSADFKRDIAEIKENEARQFTRERDYLLTRAWRKELADRGITQVSDAEVAAYYKKYPYEVSIKNILVEDPNEADQILKKLQKGASFSALAKKYSIDSASSENGGKMPPMLYGEIIPELQDVVFHMRVGELSGPIRTKFGYHVLYKVSETRVPLSEVEERIRGILEKGKLDKYLRSIENRFPVEVVDEEFK
ncbi:MAG TPA: peptidylprolyl isomerase [Elusimicrobiota bacterium]|nr:peptidylprolyl isomerase [Elusimicrobiota bacterium]